MKTNLMRPALAVMLSMVAAGAAQATVVNGSFESNFSGWTVTGDGYIVTQNGSVRSRHDYQTYQGWEGADVWFSGAAKDGSSFVAFGSQGNESTGGLTSGLWTASDQYLSFWQAGNNSSRAPDKAVAQILDEANVVLATLEITSYNDSLWREWSFDLAALGLEAGDQFRFRYRDGYSWSVIDKIATSGPALRAAAPAAAQVPEPGTLALVAIALGAAAFRTHRRPR